MSDYTLCVGIVLFLMVLLLYLYNNKNLYNGGGSHYFVTVIMLHLFAFIKKKVYLCAEILFGCNRFQSIPIGTNQ